MSLNPQFVQELMQLLSTPPLMCDLALGSLFPDKHQAFQRWVQTQENPDYAKVYDFIQGMFPTAPVRDNVVNTDALFRELFKHIVAQAFQLDYRSAVRIVVPK